MKKTLLSALMLVVVAVMFVGCKSDSDVKYNTVNIIVNGEVRYTEKYENNSEITVFALLEKLCEDKKIEIKHLDGYVNSIDGLDNNAESGWLYYLNGEMPSVGANDCTILGGFDNTIEFKYLKYSEAFPEEQIN